MDTIESDKGKGKGNSNNSAEACSETQNAYTL